MTVRRPPPPPHRSHTPWTGFTPRERKRAQTLPRCPSATCRRAKACRSAIDGLYCRRTHITPEELRRISRKRDDLMLLLPKLPTRPTLKQVQAYRLASDLLLARAEEQSQTRLAQWKAGALDHLCGPYDRRGAWMVPPPRVYVEG